MKRKRAARPEAEEKQKHVEQEKKKTATEQSSFKQPIENKIRVKSVAKTETHPSKQATKKGDTTAPVTNLQDQISVRAFEPPEDIQHPKNEPKEADPELMIPATENDELPEENQSIKLHSSSSEEDELDNIQLGDVSGASEKLTEELKEVEEKIEENQDLSNVSDSVSELASSSFSGSGSANVLLEVSDLLSQASSGDVRSLQENLEATQEKAISSDEPSEVSSSDHSLPMKEVSQSLEGASLQKQSEPFPFVLDKDKHSSVSCGSAEEAVGHPVGDQLGDSAGIDEEAADSSMNPLNTEQGDDNDDTLETASLKAERLSTLTFEQLVVQLLLGAAIIMQFY